MRKLHLFLFALPLGAAAATTALSACTNKIDEAAPLNVIDGGDELDAAKHPTTDGSLTKPPPSSKDAGGTSDAKPPPPPPDGKDGGTSDSGQIGDADLPDADPGDAAITATPLDPVDEYLMPTKGLQVGTCSDLNLANHTGLCKTNSSTGQDFVEGCVSPNAYILDCLRYETAGKTRSICTDDGKTNVGCHLLDEGKVDSFEKGQTSKALDEKHNCPSSWEGFGYCAGDYVRMCVNGKDWALDCKIYNNSTFTYTCGKSTISGNITCL